MASAGRSHRFFRPYPDRDVTLPWGSSCRLPFHCYDAEAWVIGGTVALDPLRRWLDPEGLVPVRLRAEGKRPVGAAWLWVNDYRDTNIGPYKELVVGFAAARDTFELPLRNTVSVFQPMAHALGLVFARWLFLDEEPPITLGRDVWGFPKEIGAFEMQRADDRFRCRVSDGQGREVIDVDVRNRHGALPFAVGALRVGRAFGFEKAATIALSPSMATTVVTPKDVKVSRCPARMSGRPLVYRWRDDDKLRLGTRTACGAALSDLGFSPMSVQHYDPLRFVLLEDPHTRDVPPAERVRWQEEG